MDRYGLRCWSKHHGQVVLCKARQTRLATQASVNDRPLREQARAADLTWVRLLALIGGEMKLSETSPLEVGNSRTPCEPEPTNIERCIEQTSWSANNVRDEKGE
jgi:hypothetical protein